MPKGLLMHCPHCGSRAWIRSSVAKSRTLREGYFYCSNLVCGHSWVASIEAVRTISPPSAALRHPEVNLPVVKPDELYLINDQLNAEVNNQRSIFEIFQDNAEDKS